MKKIVLLFILTFSSIWLMGQTIKTIGNGTASDEPPFGIYWGYERDASLFLRSEIMGSSTDTISIISLKWQVATNNSNPNNYPVKIYLKRTTSSTLYPTTLWETNLSGATLVYDGTACFSTTGWYTFDIADFVYLSQNLMVLCESNFGGNGSPTYPAFYYTNASNTINKNEWWGWDLDNRPLGDSVTNADRPNIQITYNTLHVLIPPSGFMATSASSSEIDLKWIKNSANENVMVAFNTANTFGTPSGTYIAGNSISGGGTVLYNGSDTLFAHTGLSSNNSYYYRAWSVHPPTPTYSPGTNAFATTFCDSTCMYPFITDFESVTFPPSCWSLASVPWIRSTSASGFGAGTASVRADFLNNSVINGTFVDLISPPLDLLSMYFPFIKFDHAYATNTNQVDSLQLWVSYDHGETFFWDTSWTGGLYGSLNTGGASGSNLFVPLSSQWATKRYALPAGTTKIMFRGVSAHGNELYLDNITFYDSCVTHSIPYSEGFDHFTTPTTGCFKVTDNNGDNIKWITSASNPRSIPNSMYINHNSTHKMADWFFTPALSLTGGTTYNVDFYYRSGGAPSVEKLEVKWGTGQDSTGMTGGQIWNNINIQTTNYQEASAEFTPSGLGPFYVGWHGYSGANMSWISVDDIYIDISFKWNGSYSSNWSDAQNWTPNGIPNEFQNVTIPSGTPHNPAISNTGLACNQLTLKSGTTLTLNPGSGLTVKANLTIQSGATLTNNGVITIKGNLINQN